MLLDPNGMPIRKISDDQLIAAVNTIGRRNQSQQLQLMQLGLLTEFLMGKLASISINGEPLFVIDEKEFEEFSKRRYEEIKIEANNFNALMQEQEKAKGSSLDLEG